MNNKKIETLIYFSIYTTIALNAIIIFLLMIIGTIIFTTGIARNIILTFILVTNIYILYQLNKISKV